MSVFRAYDIRGIYPENINEELAYKAGRAFVEFLNAKKVVIGYDMRNSSPKLFDALAKGINDQGADVINIGMCTTPMLGFSVANYTFDGGIMISASHNPSKYNGLKLIKKPALQISSESGINEIESLVEKNHFIYAGKKGNIIKKEILSDYLNHVLKFGDEISKLNIVVDYGNGVGSISAKPFFEKLPLNVISLNEKPDGTFPNHPADPHDLKNFEELKNKIKSTNSDLGIFFDGDADRSCFVDHTGEIVFADLILAVLAEHELKIEPNQKVYYDLRFSKAVKESIKNNSGIPIMMKVGNPFYKEKLINEGGILAGEFSGHIMFKSNFCLDDGLFASVKLMSIISKTGKTLKELIDPLKQNFFTSEEINMKVKNADESMKKIKEAYSEGEFTELDGIYVQYSDWWFNLRKSNTEPVVRLRLEANSKELLESKRKEIIRLLE